VIRGVIPLRVEVAPAFNYARDKHDTHILPDRSVIGNPPLHNKALFVSENLSLDFRYIAESVSDCVPAPEVNIQLLDLTSKGHLGLSASVDLNLVESQVVTFVLRYVSSSQVKRDIDSRNPDPERDEVLQKVMPSPKIAEELGIDYKTLVSGASKFRAPDDPLLTAELLSKLFIVSSVSHKHCRSHPTLHPDHKPLLGQLDSQIHLQGIVEGSRSQERFGSQAPHLRTDWRCRRQSYILPPRVYRRQQELGLPSILDPRFLLHPLRPYPVGLHRRGERYSPFPPFPRSYLTRSQPSWTLSLNVSSIKILMARFRSCTPSTVSSSANPFA
jgi:hypothetical protein